MDRENIRRLVKENKIWIFMVGRWQKDFEYVFPDVSVEGYIDDRIDQSGWQGKVLWKSKDFVEKVSQEKTLIICCYPRSFHKSEHNFYDKFHGYSCLYAEELFFLLDDEVRSNVGNRKIAVWGTGHVAERVLPELSKNFDIEYFIDSDKSKNEFHGIEIRHPDNIPMSVEHTYIVVANSYYDVISRQLVGIGLKAGEDFCNYKDFRLPSELLCRTWNDKSCYFLECQTMLHHLDVLEKGELNCCCTTFMLELLGGLLHKEFKDIWNSKWHRILCTSILNHTYSFCRRDLCPALVCKDRQDYEELFNDCQYPDVEEHPSSINICLDNACNLYCESCRDKLLVADGKYSAIAELVAEKVEQDILPHVNFIMMAGNGEVFLSKVYRKLWLSSAGKKSKYFQILTNGTLFNEKIWQDFKAERTSSVFLCVSIDAATKETYQRIRRGGNWDKLMENMRFAGNLRARGEIKYFRLNFVVQRGNYKEIPQFIEMAKSFNADRVLFTRILNWGTYSKDEFENITMVDAQGRPKPELQNILDMPVCKDSIVDIGTFNWNHVYSERNRVGSYYLWEIDNYSNMQLENDVLGM